MILKFQAILLYIDNSELFVIFFTIWRSLFLDEQLVSQV